MPEMVTGFLPLKSHVTITNAIYGLKTLKLLTTHAQSQPMQTPHQDRATQQQTQDQRAPTEKKTPDQKQATKEQNLVGCRQLLLWSVPLCVLIIAVLLNRLLF